MQTSKKTFLTIFVFILVISLIHICRDLHSAAIILSVLCSFIILNGNLFLIANRESPQEGLHDKAAAPAVIDPLAPSAPLVPVAEIDEVVFNTLVDYKAPDPAKIHLAEREHMAHKSYDTPFEVLRPLDGMSDNTFDSANALMARSRARDQRALTGAVLKDANFYKKNYGDEFVDAERRPWWGNNEY